MRDASWLKLLDLVQHKLGAHDARIEIGGNEPSDARCQWVPIDDTRRVVVVFEDAPAQPETVREKLAMLVEGFRETLTVASDPPPPRSGNALHRELDLALAQLAERTGAEAVWIIDSQSPVIWGGSEARPDDLDVDTLLLTTRADAMLVPYKLSWAELLAMPEGPANERLREAGLTGMPLRAIHDELELLRELSEAGGLAAAAARVRSARAVAEIRSRAARDHSLTRCELRGPDIQCFAHSLAAQYQLLLVFDETYSPLHAEGNVQRALPHIEKLLLSLPPVDPISGGARGAKVIRLPRK